MEYETYYYLQNISTGTPISGTPNNIKPNFLKWDGENYFLISKSHIPRTQSIHNYILHKNNIPSVYNYIYCIHLFSYSSVHGCNYTKITLILRKFYSYHELNSIMLSLIRFFCSLSAFSTTYVTLILQLSIPKIIANQQ